MIGLAEFQISTLLSAESARPLNPRRFFASQSDSSPKQTMLKSVQELFSGVETEQHHGDGAAAVTCLITDSRRVVPGALFFAIGGLRTDGNYYIEEAVDRGAVAIVLLSVSKIFGDKLAEKKRASSLRVSMSLRLRLEK